MAAFIGTAGWTIPGPIADRFAPGSSHLERYASRFNAAEINSSFHRPHRRSTYERWAATVPPGFRFAVKLPKAITHEARLAGATDALERFAAEIAGLAGARGPTLVQLPPKLAFDPAIAHRFFTDANRILGGTLVCEPRHPSWFDPEADQLLADQRVARVVADPALTQAGRDPGGDRRLAYFRLHGAPVIYRSAYAPEAIGDHADRVRALAASGDVWTIFDNTAASQAPADALALRALLT